MRDNNVKELIDAINEMSNMSQEQKDAYFKQILPQTVYSQLFENKK